MSRKSEDGMWSQSSKFHAQNKSEKKKGGKSAMGHKNLMNRGVMVTRPCKAERDGGADTASLWHSGAQR